MSILPHDAADLDTLARTIYGEAEPDDAADALAIGWTIRNRTELPNWPNTVAKVCKQKRGQTYQFTCWSPKHGQPKKLEAVTEANAWFRTCKATALDVLTGAKADPTNRATHYFATYIDWPSWAKGKKPCYETPAGKYTHIFFNDIDTPPPVLEKAVDWGKAGALAATAGSAVLGAAQTVVEKAPEGTPVTVIVLAIAAGLGAAGYWFFLRKPS